jgi:hypothetical protein
MHFLNFYTRQKLRISETTHQPRNCETEPSAQHNKKLNKKPRLHLESLLFIMARTYCTTSDRERAKTVVIWAVADDFHATTNVQ